MDHVIAEQGSYFNLPARKQGIIPGCAGLLCPTGCRGAAVLRPQTSGGGTPATLAAKPGSQPQ
jgi:hypothetical protein